MSPDFVALCCPFVVLERFEDNTQNSRSKAVFDAFVVLVVLFFPKLSINKYIDIYRKKFFKRGQQDNKDNI